jgi:hypothetical protein
MDVDPAPNVSTKVPIAAPMTPTTVCLPYSLVPGLDLSSRSYQRAISTLGKQQSPQVPVAPKVPLVSVLDRGM